MKKISMILSAVLAAAMAVPTISNAANKYPSNPGYIRDAKNVLSEEEYEEYCNGWDMFGKELCIGYQNGEYDFDFDLNGVVDALDALPLMCSWGECGTGVWDNIYWDTSSSDENDWTVYEYTDETHEKCIEDGDIDGNGYVDATDIYYMYMAIYSAVKKGDVNLDGFVDANDASLILSYYSKKSTVIRTDLLTETNMDFLGDVNGDGKIDAADASAVLEEYSANSVSG